MGIFDGLGAAQVFEGGNYLQLGVYDLEVIRCMIKPSRASGNVFIAELKVLSSTVPAQPPGVTVSFCQKMQDQAIAFAAIKEFVIALLGYDLKTDKARIAAELDPQIGALTDAAVSERNIFAGKRVHCETYEKETKVRKISIILPRWSPLRGDVAAPAVMAPATPFAPPPPHVPAPAPMPGPTYPPQGHPAQHAYHGAPPPPPAPVLVNGQWVYPR